MDDKKFSEAPESIDWLADFPEHRYEDWKKAAERLLKGRSFEEVLTTATEEDITLAAIYWPEAAAEAAQWQPGEKPYVRGRRPANKNSAGWQIAQQVYAESDADWQAGMAAALKNGQNTLVLPPTDSRRPMYQSLTAFQKALGDLPLTAQPIYCRSASGSDTLLALIVASCAQKGLEPEKISGCLGADPIGEFARRGRLPAEIIDHQAALGRQMKWAAKNMPDFRIVDLRANLFHEAGATAVQELAAAAAIGVGYLDLAINAGIDAGQAAGQIQHSYAIDGQFFLNIAKLRAARQIWSRITDAFGAKNAPGLFTMASGSRRNKTIYDAHVNILRATTEAQSAALGGADAIEIPPFDLLLRQPNEFSQRIARNIHLLLREESYLDKVVDAAGGSGYVESLTWQLAEKAWTLFQDIEGRGGILAVLKNGMLAEAISATVKEREKKIATRELPLIGTSVSPLLSEELQVPMPDLQNEEALPPVRNIEKLIDHLRTGHRVDNFDDSERFQKAAPTSQINAFKPLRLAERFENIRAEFYDIRKNNGPTAVTMLCLGSPAPLRERIDFAREYLAVGGLTISSTIEVEMPPRDAAAIRDGKFDNPPDILLICGSDSDYRETLPTLLPAFYSQGDKKPFVILAGNPGDQRQALIAAGVDLFIFAGSDICDTLEKIAETLRTKR